MSVSRVLVIIAVALSSNSPASAQDCPPHPDCVAAGLRTWCADDYPAILGVTIGSSLSSVKKALGEPSVENSPTYDDLFLTWVVDLEYDGLNLETIRDNPDEPFTVSRIESSSPNWPFQRGPTVGDPRSEVIEKLGAPDAISTEGETETLSYFQCPADVRTHIVIRKETVIEIVMWFDWV